MRHALAAATCALLATAGTAGATGTQTAPKLRVVDLQPILVVRGSRFEPRTKVRVTLSYEEMRRTRFARVTNTGWFVVMLGSLPGFDPCRSVFHVAAVGNTGERAAFKFIARDLCPPPTAP